MARLGTEVQKSQQAAGGCVVVQRDRDHAREPIVASLFNCAERECRANALSMKIVCDFDRDLGDLWLIRELDVAGDGLECASGVIDRGQRLMLDVVDVEESVKVTLAERGFRREISLVAGFGR
jgi:hypothetical protein